MTAGIKDDILHGGILLFLLAGIFVFLVISIPYEAALILAVLSISVFLVSVICYKPVVYIYLYVLSMVLFLDNSPGIQTTDLIFFILTILFALFFTIPYLITDKAKIDNPLDFWYLLFVVCLIFGFVNGLIHSTNKMLAVSDLTYFIGLALYFPLKEHFNDRRFKKTLAIILGLILFFVLIRNFINYREIILQSVQKWQVEKARVAKNEIVILSGAVISLNIYLISEKLLVKTITLICYGAFVIGLVLTQSRGYWIGFIMAILFLMIISGKKIRRQIIKVHLAVAILALVILLTLFNHELSIIIKALSERVGSIDTVGSVSKMGPSLLERVYEAKQIVHWLAENPVVGYGLGATYHRYYILFATYREMTYIHDGYLAIWFKTGFLGLTSILIFNILTLKYAVTLYKQSQSKSDAILYMSIGSILFAMLICNIANSQYMEFESVAMMAAMGAIISRNFSLKPDTSEKNQDRS